MYCVRLPRAARKLSTRLLSEKSTRVKELTDKFNAEITSNGVVPGFKLAAIFNDRIAIQDPHGEYTYKGLFNTARGLANEIIFAVGGKTQLTVAYLCPGDSSHILTQWAIWMSGNIAVPLSPQHPPPLLEYFLKDSGAAVVVCEQQLLGNLPKVGNGGAPVITLPETLRSAALLDTLTNNSESTEDESGVNLDGLPDGKFYADSDALILYTSGTTSKPKGVVYGFRQLSAQVASLHEAWQYRSSDVLLHVLPLHHVHGQVNSVAAGLAAGAIIRMLPAFSPSTIWSHLLGMKKRDNHRVSILMGVPTMYSKLIQEYEKVFTTNSRHKEYIKSVLKTRMRLMISGSAPLPTPVFQRWEDISGHRLLERYGMTEIGMALSNPYEPMKDRTPGAVGIPLPGVTVRISSVDPKKGIKPLVSLTTPPPSLQVNLSKIQYQSAESQTKVKNLFIEEQSTTESEIMCSITYEPNVNKKESVMGELFVKGRGVFSRYWMRPEQTAEEFTTDGWFRTGDTAMLDDGKVRILGRTSVDIIKSGGYKISALDVETLVLGHPAVSDAAVLGLPDHTWGENVAAVIELKKDSTLTLKELQEWGVKYVPKYQVPTVLFLISKIPRNAMGKVNKKELRQTLLTQKSSNS